MSAAPITPAPDEFPGVDPAHLAGFHTPWSQPGERHLELMLDTTNKCNLRCVMFYTDCFNRPEKIREELTTTEILRIMDELAEAGCIELALTGGEPLARSDFFDIYEHARTGGFLVTLLTNGTLITEEIADRLASLPPHRIEISLHGITERTFEQVTQGSGSFARCMRAIGLLCDRKLPLLLKTTAMTVNRDEVLAIKRYVNGLQERGHEVGYNYENLSTFKGDRDKALSDFAEKLASLRKVAPVSTSARTLLRSGSETETVNVPTGQS